MTDRNHAPVVKDQDSALHTRHAVGETPAPELHSLDALLAAFEAMGDKVFALDDAPPSDMPVAEAAYDLVARFGDVLKSYACAQKGRHSIVNDHCCRREHMYCSACGLCPSETPGWAWDDAAKNWCRHDVAR